LPQWKDFSLGQSLFIKNMKISYLFLSFLATIGVRTATDHRKWSWVEMEKVASLEVRQLFFIFFQENEKNYEKFITF
jgi:hypothetical protein